MNQGRSFADPWSVTIDKAPGDLLYYMAGGDGRTKTYALSALPVALVESVSLDYDFPAYAKAPRREDIEDGNVEALQGTRVTVTATTNQPARSGLLDFGPRPPVALVPEPGNNRKLSGSFMVEADGQYSVKFNTVDGQTNPEPVLYDIRVVKDVSPTARFIRPESPTQRPANARVPLVVEASDDFGITSALLHVYKGGEILQQAVELIDPKSPEAVKQFQKTIALDLQPLSLRDGDRIQYWLTLKDNCELQSNRFETPKQEIVIAPPVTEPEREQLAQNEMAQAREDTGEQDPMPENQQGQSDQDNAGLQNPPDQGRQGDQQKSQDEQKKVGEQKKDGQGKSGQGEQSEPAEPNANAQPGGQQGQGKSKPSQDDAQNKSQQNKGQSGKGGQSKEGGEQSKQASQKDGSGTGADSKSGGQEKGKSGGQEKGEQSKSSERKAQQKASQKGGENQTGEETGKAEPGQRPDGTERSTSKNGGQEKGEQGKSGGQEKGEQGKSGGQEKSAAKSDQTGQSGSEQQKAEQAQTEAQQKKAEGTEREPGEDEKGEQSKKSDSDRLPDGEPRQGQGGEQSKPRSLDELTQEDREKLNKLREALKSNEEPQPGEPPSGEPEQVKSGGQEKGEQGKSGGQEKGEQGKSGSQEKSEQGKSGGQEKGEQGKEKGKEKSEQGKAGEQPGQGGQPGDESKDDAAKSKSKESGEEKGRPGALPDDVPKAGGMREGFDDVTPKPDDAQPSPRAVEPEDQSRDDLSPQQKADQRLINRLRQMVDKNEITKDLEESTGLTREEIDQFVRKYEPPPKDERTRAPADSTEITTKSSGDDRERRVNLPGEVPSGQVISRTGRGSGMVKDDDVRGNLEGARSRIPSALRSRYEAYQKALSRSSGGTGSPSTGAPAPSNSPRTGTPGTNAATGTDRR
jgi:hypothetical protein